MNISANELKTRGTQAIEEALSSDSVATITVRGRCAYVVTSVSEYDEFREWQLDKALKETEGDLQTGRFEVLDNIEDHIRDLSHD
ncbi:type II toxin-antitoxin system prevent-host-death family antitoxin [Vibrio mediterranei]|uniref:Prevent-host-death protein n=1 Tax=Vibrio mediterranei TaxID=689 RepID=A0ABX5D7S0_9VIBR|nr:type II toxin-antitoxin system prevent-host-death family antitoxin [Vibrio mediterranei]PCD85333.1 prevent-host-death protein [Vibrio mediterranei]PRQ64520.1 prevent-host-death protein [Vibrio mediterranei]